MYIFQNRILNYLIIKRIDITEKIKKVKDHLQIIKVTLKIFDNLNVKIEKKSCQNSI